MSSTLFQHIPLLAELPQNEQESLQKLFQERKVKKNAHIIHANDQASSLMFLQGGRAKVSLTSRDGKEVILSYLETGSFFGEIALLTGEDRSADVIAIDECTILILSQENFEKHVSEYTGLTLSLLKILALRLRTASNKIGDLALLDVNRRVASTLENLASKKGIDGKESLYIEKRPTHQELAALVGTSREMVTRALKSLEEEECISLNGKSVLIHHLPY